MKKFVFFISLTGPERPPKFDILTPRMHFFDFAYAYYMRDHDSAYAYYTRDHDSAYAYYTRDRDPVYNTYISGVSYFSNQE